MNAAPTRVRVVIPCRNEVGYIGLCLHSLVDADRSGMALEVHVCDGMSEDGTREEVATLVADHPWIRLVDNPARTTPHALNLGLRPEGYDVGIILGAHAEVARDFLRENLAVLEAHPEAGCVGGVIENVYSDATSRRIGAAMGHAFGVGSAHFRTGLREGPVDTVAFGAYRREVFGRVGWFDERLERNQDDEFNYRLTRAGYRIVLSMRIRSHYHVRGTYGRLFRQYRQYGYWKVYVNRLHGRVTTLRQLVPAAWVLYLAMGPLLAWSSFWGALLWPFGVAVYLLLAAVSAVGAARKGDDVPGVLLAFLTLHLAYGFGYLHGVVTLLLLRREPGHTSRSSSR
jgi:glycosyltransferase involved in cell wall biosynthesis